MNSFTSKHLLKEIPQRISMNQTLLCSYFANWGGM